MATTKSATTKSAEPAERKNPRWVRATSRGYYGQMREEGDVFENTLDLAGSWIVAAKEPAPQSEEE